jgi:hypothetical protein
MSVAGGRGNGNGMYDYDRQGDREDRRRDRRGRRDRRDMDRDRERDHDDQNGGMASRFQNLDEVIGQVNSPLQESTSGWESIIGLV